MKLTKIIELFKELKWFFGFLGITGATSVEYYNYILAHNLHIILLIFGAIHIMYIFTNKRISSMENKFADMIIDQSKQRLETTVENLYYKYKNVKEITDEDVIKRVLSLEDNRVELGVNSYTQWRLEVIMNKIKK